MLLPVKKAGSRTLLPIFAAPGAAFLIVLAAAAPALAAPAATKLTLTGPKHAPAPGGSATLTATLEANGSPLAGKVLSLTSGPAQVAGATTDANGRAAFKVTVSAPATYRATYAPAPADAPAYAVATSNAVKVTPAVGLRFAAHSYLRARRRAVGVAHERVSLRGTVGSFTAGESAQLLVFRGHRLVKRITRPLVKLGRGARFRTSLRPARRGVYRIRATVHGASATTRVYVVRPHASQGSRGTAVRALQSRLRKLGYLTPVNGVYDASTSRAVLAFTKVNGYPRGTVASKRVFKKLARGAGGFHLRHPKAGKHAEFDWSRQVLVLARGGKPDKILHASSGKPSTPTVFGTFRFYAKSPGFNAEGMYYSNYFIGGYAIHGYESVPAYAASHGCIRIPIPSAISVYRWISLGDTIYVYH